VPGRDRAEAAFDADVIEAHPDHLAGAQADDGGWTFNWPSRPPAAGRRVRLARLPHRRRAAGAARQRARLTGRARLPR
jgi:hypothetical protein